MGKEKIQKIKRPHVPLKYNNLKQEIGITIATEITPLMTKREFFKHTGVGNYGCPGNVKKILFTVKQ